MKKFTGIALLALLIAVIAPLWAALSGYFGLLVGAVALICAGIYVANGSQIKNALKITLGFLAGNVWAYLVLQTMGAIMGAMTISFHLLLFLTLFVFAIAAVFIACYLEKIFDLSAWLAGWAVTLTIIPLSTAVSMENMLLQIGIAMVAGVWVVGVLITSAHGYLVKKFVADKK